MARIWMTYIELGDLLRCSPMDARDYTIEHALVLRKSRSGQTWTELGGALASAFIARIHPSGASWPGTEMDQAVADLQDIYEEMARRPGSSELRKKACPIKSTKVTRSHVPPSGPEPRYTL